MKGFPGSMPAGGHGAGEGFPGKSFMEASENIRHGAGRKIKKRPPSPKASLLGDGGRS
jgi:hypothetical protein